MDPNETLRLWHSAVERNDREAALEHATDLADWLNNDGFEPLWTEQLKIHFWAWWDSTFDSTTSYHDESCEVDDDGLGCTCGAASTAPRCPKCGAAMRACASGEPDNHCDGCGHVEPAGEPSDVERAAEELLAELEEAGIAEAGAPPQTPAEAGVVKMAERLRRALLKTKLDPSDAGAAAIFAEVIAWIVEHEPRDPDTRKVQQRLLREFESAAALTREALAEAECWLENHGAIYCEDEGGEKEPGLARLLGLVRGALGTLGAPEPETPGEWRCPECGDPDIEGTAWVGLNSGLDVGSEPPTTDHWCPRCEDTHGEACCVDKATGLCTMHVEPAGAACKPKGGRP